ncbi:NUDIX domain-containing protein [Erythrobacter sp. SCSIO 43205]|uniref:NUDIX domain-containing protein n=1 Tax=Erythrobacter sp. SCSIO 43205 TaxID=2779361 RepID=UPI001CA825F3|nr:NUDIX domain-containing protein [Erythrobacter sp. SCSIO 43205]UAB77800.1 NUDIX domain-containing protein [Erythrobacter sp. SCSIO 43205]
MLHLIEKSAERVLPAPLHRALLQLAHKVRHRWRKWRKTPISGISVIVTNPAGEVMLLRHSYGPKAWGLPGGGMAAGEDPHDCARRELVEEVRLDTAQLKPLGVLNETLSGSPHTSHVFTVEVTQQPKPDGREILEARFFAPHALPELLTRNVPKRLAMWEAWKVQSKES